MEYLASPYSHPDPLVMERRFEQVMEVAAKLIHSGRIIYSPILHFHPIAVSHNLPKDFTFWQIINKEILSRCDRLLVLRLVDFERSEGVRGEINHARLLGIPTSFVEPSAWLT